MKTLRVIIILIASLLTCSPGLCADRQIKLSTSIKPLQLIAAAIMEGVAEPSLALGPGQDSHHAALRPSGRRELADADVVLWLGPMLESSLSKVVVVINGDVITVQSLAGIKLINLGNEVDKGSTLESVLDPHLWLDTNNALVIAEVLVERLTRLDALNAKLYQDNLNTFTSELRQLEIQINQQFEPYHDIKFAVYHNALQYFEGQFSLQHEVSFTELESENPGIRKLLTVKKKLEAMSINCILVEPEVNIEELESIIEDSSMRYLSVDVMGSMLPVAQGSYIRLIQNLSNTMVECLQ